VPHACYQKPFGPCHQYCGRRLRALAQIESTGLSRSEAIRQAILDSAARRRRRDALAAEVAALEADEGDQREMLEVADFMESMRAAE
jgi:hypothetical protein